MQTTAVTIDCRIEASTPEQVEQEIKLLRTRAMQALGKNPGASHAGAGAGGRSHTTLRQRTAKAAKTPGPQRLRGKRTPQRGNGKISDQQLLSALEGAGGITARALGQELGVSQDTALRKLKMWEAQGKAFREGERAQTRWFARQPVTA